jgi:hypothetical protein
MEILLFRRATFNFSKTTLLNAVNVVKLRSDSVVGIVTAVGARLSRNSDRFPERETAFSLGTTQSPIGYREKNGRGVKLTNNL